MSGAKEIRTKIKSIQNTQKITKAMEMVAASKMRRAQERMNQARPYAEKMANVMAHLAQANLEYKHSYTESRDPKRVGFIVVSSDRGLCGGLNINLFRQVLQSMSEWRDKGVEIDVTIIGRKGLGFFKRVGVNIVSEATQLGDKPQLADLIGAMKVMMDAFSEGRIDRLFLAHNGFVTTMTQEPRVDQLLPVSAAEPDERKRTLAFFNLGWGDAEAAELRLALQYAAAKCAFPEGAVRVAVTDGNRISEEALATLPPPRERSNDYTEESVDWGAPGDARHAWKGKFFTM